MPGYLTQIASSGFSHHPGSPLLTPTVRSRSPIAERDQRLSLNEAAWNLDNITANETPAVSLFEAESATASHQIGEASVGTPTDGPPGKPSSIPIPRAAAVPRPSSPTAGMPRASISESPARPSATSRVEGKPGAVGPGDPSYNASHNREPMDESFQRPVASHGRVVGAGATNGASALIRSIPTGAQAPTTVGATAHVASAHFPPAQSPRRPAPSEESAARRNAFGHLADASRGSSGPGSRSPTAGTPAWEPKFAATSPGVIIGRIDVEIVPPPSATPVAQPSKPLSPPSGPVSQIGPLGGVPPHLRFPAHSR